jgi:hypothetical protein
MRIFFIALLCLGFAGCATTKQEASTTTPVSKSILADVEVFDISWLDKVISVFTNELKTRPDQGGIYYNRAIAYYYRREFDKSWDDIHKAQALGCKIESRFLEKLKTASGKE